ncbi:MAG: competence/damage-inducible protein A [Vicinamibacterales bacterium]
MNGLSRAAIIAVGSELLTASRVDTNSLFITDRVNTLGVDVVFKAVVGDDREELAGMVRLALTRADLVICCGGLGPTDDDVTREAAAAAVGLHLREDEAITERLRVRFKARFTGEMPEINRRQAMVPDGARVIENPNGSAPGLWIDVENHAVLLLPGPPRELKPMVDGLVAGLLRERCSGRVLMRRVLKIAGRIESQTEEELMPLYVRWRNWPIPVEATILASLGQLELHLSARAPSGDEATAVLREAVEDVIKVLGADVFTTEGRDLEEVLGDLLLARGFRIAVAESCTGGLIASRLTDVAGSSRYVERGVVAYSNEAKSELLGVPSALIAEYGAVSEPVGRAMAEGIRSQARVDVGVGVTGIAGPGGGSPEKPVGTVVIAVSVGQTVQTRTARFRGERDQVKYQAAQTALDMVRRLLLPGP